MLSRESGITPSVTPSVHLKMATICKLYQGNQWRGNNLLHNFKMMSKIFQSEYWIDYRQIYYNRIHSTRSRQIFCVFHGPIKLFIGLCSGDINGKIRKILGATLPRGGTFVVGIFMN